jgi:hypothetical protein
MPRSTKTQAKGFALNHDLPNVRDSDAMLTGPMDIIPADLAAELGLPPGTRLGMQLGDAEPGDYRPPYISGGELAGRSLGATPTPPREPPPPDSDPEPHAPPEPDDPDDDPDEEEDDPEEDEEPTHTGLSYESRIRILAAWQYTGVMKGAPKWVDRNWLAWGDYDQLRGIEPGPALRIPMPNGENVMCRIGDYVCRQSVTISPGIPPDERIEVWEQKQFERLFLPSHANIVGVTRTIEHDPRSNLATQNSR